MKLELNAVKRELGKKSERKTMRQDGFIPAVLYGGGSDGLPVTINEREFVQNYRKSFGHVAFWDLKIGDETVTAVIKDKQVHPVSRKIVHIDFMELHKGKSIVLDIPVNYNGTPVGTKTGGAVDYLLRSLTVHSLPKDVKDSIDVDISELDIGDTISVGDLELGEMETRIPLDVTVVHVYIPRIKAEDTEEEAEEEIEGEGEGEGEGVSEKAKDSEK
ncbi:MAG: 50S ribosomal protein L25 [Candidatus Cloacimonetes bacterium]|nr:50S ribosomal protein L25 [Candidatus Cloacimonadota bacterium]